MRFSKDAVLTSAIVVGALALGSVVSARLPVAEDVHDQPFVRSGGVGDTVTLRTMDVRVTKVDAAREVTVGKEVAVTGATFLVVWYDLTAKGEPGFLSPAKRLVAADGRTFSVLGALANFCLTAQPGVPKSCTLVFEVPPDALPGARLRVPAAAWESADDVADIDLGITPELVVAWGGRSDRITAPTFAREP